MSDGRTKKAVVYGLTAIALAGVIGGFSWSLYRHLHWRGHARGRTVGKQIEWRDKTDAIHRVDIPAGYSEPHNHEWWVLYNEDNPADWALPYEWPKRVVLLSLLLLVPLAVWSYTLRHPVTNGGASSDETTRRSSVDYDYNSEGAHAQMMYYW